MPKPQRPMSTDTRQAPESVVTDLKAIRTTLELRFNPTAVKRSNGYIDASGAVRAAEYDPRWELWDTDADNREYRVMTLQDIDGNYREPGQWLVEHMRFWNPERFGGDPNRMLLELMDNPQELMEKVNESDQDDVFEMVARMYAYHSVAKEPVLKSMDELRVEHATHQAAREARAATATPNE